MEGAWEKQQSANRQQPTVKDKNLSIRFFWKIWLLTKLHTNLFSHFLISIYKSVGGCIMTGDRALRL